MCPGCLRPLTDCVCKTKHPTLGDAGDGVVRLHRETKGRKGSGVTLVRGLAVDEVELKALAKALKAACGVGGAIKDGVIELQGEQREKIKPLLESRGYKVKIAGG